jgi:hypothetical protein
VANFYHLGYFPFCVQAPLESLSRAVEMPLADAMKLFWLAKQARFVLQYSYNAHLPAGGGGASQEFVRATVNIDQSVPVYNASQPAQRVCIRDPITISGSQLNEDGEGSTQYIVRMFATSGFSSNEQFPPLTADNAENISPDATVRVSCVLRIINSGYYSFTRWENTLTPPLLQFSSIVVPFPITIDGSTYNLSSGVGYTGYPFILIGGALPDPSYGDFKLEFTT